jgi:phospholipid/cholesterol/gamma-HCH transport system substrate-binding protein
MRRKMEVELQAGIFIFIGILAAMVTILMMGGGEALFEKNYKIFIEVSDVAGLAKGASVSSGGLKVGTVEEIKFSDNYENVRLTLKIKESAKQRIREDSVVRFQTQGVLGDKYLEIFGGSADKPVVADGGTLGVEQGKDMAAMFAEGSSALGLLKDNLANLKVLTTSLAKQNKMEAVMKDLAETSANMKDITKQLKGSNAIADLGATTKNLRVITDKVKNGEGTVGALLSDPSLYEDLKNLIGGANRNSVLKFFVRQAVKSSDDAAAKAEKAEEKNPAPKKK